MEMNQTYQLLPKKSESINLNGQFELIHRN